MPTFQLNRFLYLKEGLLNAGDIFASPVLVRVRTARASCACFSVALLARAFGLCVFLLVCVSLALYACAVFFLPFWPLLMQSENRIEKAGFRLLLLSSH